MKDESMNKYIFQVKESLNIQTDLPESRKDETHFVDVFLLENQVIYECNPRNVLQDMLQKEDLRYVLLDELLPGFHFEEYKELYPHLQHLTQYEIIHHYMQFLYKDKIKYTYQHIPNDFDPNVYKELHPDLQRITASQLKNHYEHNGYKENRKYKYEHLPCDFDPHVYRELQPDLQRMTASQLKHHYENCGYKENRKYKYTKSNV